MDCITNFTIPSTLPETDVDKKYWKEDKEFAHVRTHC